MMAGSPNQAMAFWDEDVSWEDSERFDDDSMCSWMSDESLCQNWRGWSGRAANAANAGVFPLAVNYTGGIAPIHAFPATQIYGLQETRYEKKLMSLLDLSARCVAQCMSFEEIEAYTNNYSAACAAGCRSSESSIHDVNTSGGWIQAINEAHVQMRLGYFCFPSLEDDIRLYSCLANGNADEFHKGMQLFRANAVKDLLQIGFHLTATVVVSSTYSNMPRHAAMHTTSNNAATTATAVTYNVAVTVDRCKITSCTCSCCDPSWCCHVVAMCLFRIHQPDDVQYRPSVSESLVRLREPEMLRKFAQYLIAELPREFLPTAQRLLDKCLDKDSKLNAINGAPDPTAYTCSEDVAGWWLDEQTLKDNIRKILLKFCVPSPTVLSDVQYLSSNQPAVATEWQALVRPLRSREPEGLWNLLSIVREMYRRHDINATKLLHIITEQCLTCSQVILWWYQTKLSQSGKYPLNSCSSSLSGSKSGLASNHQNAQYSCASLCDQIVALWRLAALNPQLSDTERTQLAAHLTVYHRRVVSKIWSILGTGGATGGAQGAGNDRPAVVTAAAVTASGLIPTVPGFGKLTHDTARFDLDSFSGFSDAIASCQIDWMCAAQPLAATPLSIECTQTNSANTSATSPFTVCAPNRSPFSPSCLPILRDKTINKDNQQGIPSTGSAETLTLGSPSTHHLVSPRSHPVALTAAMPTTNVSASHEPATLPSSPESGQGSTISGSRRGVNLDESAGAESAFLGSSRALSVTPPPMDAKAAELDYLLGIYLAQDDDTSQSVQPQQQQPRPQQPSTSKQVPTCPLDQVQQWLDALSKPSDPLDILWARCEALDAHGYAADAARLAEQLAHHILVDPHDLCEQVPGPVAPPANLTPTKHQSASKRKKKLSSSAGAGGSNFDQPTIPHPKAIALSRTTCRTMQRVLYLLNDILLKTRQHDDNAYDVEEQASKRLLAFRLGLWALETNRQPAATKYLEVQLYHLQAEILAALRRIELGQAEMALVREHGNKLRLLGGIGGAGTTGTQRSVLPISLAHFVFEALSCRRNANAPAKHPGDEQLGFDAALVALSLKSIVSDVEHPLLCEGTRRLRGDLAVELLLRYKDVHEKLGLIMDRVLDPSLHRMYKHSASNAVFYGHHHSKTNVQAQQPQDPTTSNDHQHRDSTDDEVAQLAVHMQHLGHHVTGIGGARSSTDGDTTSGQLSRETSPQSTEATSDASSQQGGINMTSTGLGTSTQPQNVKMSRRRAQASCAPNQPSEALAHYMTELSKRLLIEAGGSHSTAIFSAPQHNANAQDAANAPGQGLANNAQQQGPHRHLHLCAFQIGLYALGLNNKVTPNWPSRTYSSHVSWISGQAIEIGRTAIRILIDTWQNHLTPAEVAGLADKASQGREPAMVQAAAELALSALPHAHALNPNEIQRALVQCREQNTSMLEKACLAVESAAKDYGVYPETLFAVARRWYDLHQEQEQRDSQRAQAMPQQQNIPNNAGPVYVPQQHQQQQQPQQPVVAASQQQQQQGLLPPVVSQAQPPQPMMPGPPPPPHFMAPPNAQQPNAPNAYPHHMSLQGLPIMPNAASAGAGHPPMPMFAMMRPPPMAAGQMYMMPQRPGFPYPPAGAPNNYQHAAAAAMSYQQQRAAAAASLHSSHSAPNLAPPHHHNMRGARHVHQQHVDDRASEHSKYLNSVYRVGLLAMETWGKRAHDERSYIKFSQNPPYGDDVMWLFTIAQKLGSIYTHQFCITAAQNVVSPFVLGNLAMEAMRLFPANAQQQTGGPLVPPLPTPHLGTNASSNNGGAYTQRLQQALSAIANSGESQAAAHLLQRCLQMYYMAAISKLSHTRFLPSDVEEVCNLVRSAKTTFFHHLPRVNCSADVLFQDYLQHMRRQKSCKKDVWAKITAIAYPTS